MYDVIVVGGRCAGAATAMLLSRRGQRVLLLDRATSPSDTLCAHLVSPSALALLARWDVLGVVSRFCPTADATLVRVGERTDVVPNAVVVGTDLSRAPRRRHLDAALADAAREAGALVREGLTVRDLVWDGDRVVGVVAQGADGHSVCETARVVIGADGRSSAVARIVDASTIEEHAATACCYYAYWAGTGASRPEWHVTQDNAVGVLPTGDGLAAVVVRAPIGEWARFKRAPQEFSCSIVDRLPGLGRRLARGNRESRFFGTADLGAVVRQPAGRGWALAGDAAHHDDPLLWSGIAAAFTDAALMAAALHDGLSGQVPLDQALDSYRTTWEDTWAGPRAALGPWRGGPPTPEGWAAMLDAAQQAVATPVRELLAASRAP